MRHICQNVSVFFNIFSEHFFHIFETVNEYGTTFLLSWCLLSETVTIEMLSFSNNIISVTRASLFVFQRALATSSWYKQANFLQNPFESLQYLKDAWHLIKCIWQLIKCCIRTQWSYRSLSKKFYLLKRRASKTTEHSSFTCCSG